MLFDRRSMRFAIRRPRVARHLAAAGFLALFGSFLPQVASATDDSGPHSALGSYIAGGVARSDNDNAAAVDLYRHALAAAPNQPRIIEQAFLVEASEGHATQAIALARRLIRFEPDHRLAQAWLGLAAFKNGNFKLADQHFQKASAGPIGQLTSALARAWVAQRRGQRRTAMSRLKYSQRAEWAQYYLRYHRALIADLNGDSQLAGQNYSRIFKSDARMPRVTISYLRHATHNGDFSLAERILEQNEEATTGEIHPAVESVSEAIEKNRKLPLLVQSADDGLAEVFYGIGEALTTEGGLQLGAIYLQMALYIKPDFPFARAALANVYESTKRYATANAIYETVPKDSPLRMLIDIRKARNLDALDRPDEARDLLLKVAADYPGDIRPIETLAHILRARERYEEAITQYSRILKMLGEPEPSHWTYWYARGTSYERTKQWQKAEQDLLRANELSPDQPLVLNYLGYSWVDRNIHLKRGLEFIEKAVQLKPEDGYIVDSLGWAHFRLGNYPEAVEQLERAVELRPADPILNDHLGDAYWRLGRVREARFQWEQSLTLSPTAENAAATREKIAKGLPAPAIKAAKPAEINAAKAPPLGKRAEAAPKEPIR